MRRLLLAALVTLGPIAIVGVADLALTPDFKADLWTAGTAVVDHFLVRALVLGCGVAFVLSRCVAVWEHAEREYQRPFAEAETKPETFRAPCGEVIRINFTNDRGPWAA